MSLVGEGTYDDMPLGGEPPHAQDRLWRHPAERGAAQAAANMAARQVPGRRWPAMLVSFIAGGTLVGLVWLLQAQTEAPPRVENRWNEITPPATEAAIGPLPFDEFINDVVELNRSSVVGLYLGGDATVPHAHAIRLGTAGHLVTSAHALDGAADIRVVFPNGDTTAAEVVATDSVSGVGVLKVNATDLDPPSFSDDDDVVVSDRLVALAHPMDADDFARAVHVLGEDHVASMPDGELLSGLFRLSTDLGPGWSGAAVLEENGGIVAMTVEARDGSHYALPMNRVRRIAQQLIDSGTVDVKAWIGVEMDDLSDRIKTERELLGGVLMRRVWDETPAAKGGLVAGDIVVGVGDANILDRLDLQLALAALQPGDTVEVRYSRVNASPTETIATVPEPAADAEIHTTRITVGARPSA